MARSIQEIYDSIIAEKESMSSLDGLLPVGAKYNNVLSELSSGSKVAVWRLIIYVVAVSHWVHEKYWDYAKQELNAIAEQSIAGNLEWYKNEVKKWQYGFLLLWNSQTYRYYYNDTTSQLAIESKLADRVAVVEVFSQDFRGLKIKVAKETPQGLKPLEPIEIESLQSYIDRIKFAGVETDVISQESDKLNLSLKIYYQGTLDEANVKASVKNAIENYIANIEFDGIFYIIKMVDEIQKVLGVKDVVIMTASGRSYLGSYNNFYKDYTADSGWIELDSNSNIEMIKA